MLLRISKIAAIALTSAVTFAACAGGPPRPRDETANPRAEMDAAPDEGDAARDSTPPVTPAPDAASSRPPLVASSDLPRSPRLRVRRLPALQGADPKDCIAEAVLARLGTGCRRLRSRSVEGTGTVSAAAPAPAAFDGDLCTHWNSGGFAPQAIRAEIADEAPLSGVLLVPEMLPGGKATHVLDLGGTVYVVESSWTSEGLSFVLFDRPESARSITVRTTASPSWIAWREIVPFACERAAVPPDATEESPKTPQPASAPQWAEVRRQGMGACTTDADCVPASCCHPRTCMARATAPRCGGIGCPQNVVPGTIGNGARCACIQRRCGAIARERVDHSGGLL